MSKELLRDFLDLGGDSVLRGTELYEYINSLQSNTIEYRGDYYSINLTYYQDVPEFEIFKIDMENILQLEED